MERKDLKPSEEVVLNLYNSTHENKIELEKVKGFYFDDREATITMYSDDLDAVCGEDRAYIETTFTEETVKEYDHRKYHRAIELAAHAVRLDQSPFEDRFISAQDMSNLNYIYYNYDKVLENYVTFIVSKISNGLVEVDTSYNNIFYAGDEVSFCDLKGDKHRLKFEWLVSPDFEYLKKYFTNYKKAERREKIYKCQDDIETFKKLIAEREEELKKLEEEGN